MLILWVIRQKGYEFIAFSGCEIYMWKKSVIKLIENLRFTFLKCAYEYGEHVIFSFEKRRVVCETMSGFSLAEFKISLSGSF